MSQQSQAILAGLDAAREYAGEDVLLRGVTYRVRSVEVAGAKAGEQAVSHAQFGIYIASTTPRMFVFDPMDFAPNTAVTPPKETDEITRNNLVYVISAVDYENVDGDTVAINAYALRKIWAV